MGKKKSRCYIITGEKTRMLYGAFSYDEEGKEMAEEYIKTLSEGETLIIEEK